MVVSKGSNVKFCSYHISQAEAKHIPLTKKCAGLHPDGTSCNSFISSNFLYCFIHRYQKVIKPEHIEGTIIAKKCGAYLQNGESCPNEVKGLYTYCYTHRSLHFANNGPSTCYGKTVAGNRCKNKVLHGKYCKIHQSQDPSGGPKGAKGGKRPLLKPSGIKPS
jgi:hypothetical protein